MSIRLWIFGGLVGVLTLHLSTPAWGSEGSKPSTAPSSNSDYWDDDDIWNDWGSPKTEKKNDKENREEPKDDLNAANGAPGSAAASSGFSGSSDKVQFRLVGENSEAPRGVRKYRPTYGQSRKRSL